MCCALCVLAAQSGRWHKTEVRISKEQVPELGDEVVTATLHHRDTLEWAQSEMCNPAYKDTWVSHSEPLFTVEGATRVR